MTDIDDLPFEARRLDKASLRIVSAGPQGARTVWRSWGSGKPLVFVHGGAGSWLHWLKTIPVFMDMGYEVIVPDLPGFGESDSLSGEGTIEALAQALVLGLRGIVPGRRCHLAGFSFGGVVASHMAIQLGSMAQSLTLCGSGGLGSAHSPMYRLVKWRGLPQAEQRQAHRENLEILMFADRLAIEDGDVAIQAYNAERARGSSRNHSRTEIVLDALRMLDIPVSGVWGEKDVTVAGLLEEREGRIHQVAPAARLFRIRQAGHWLQHETPDEFNDLLARILEPPGNVSLR